MIIQQHIRKDSRVSTSASVGVEEIVAEKQTPPPEPVNTVEAARAKGVCRICGEPESAPFVYDFGTEFAHASYLDKAFLARWAQAEGRSAIVKARDIEDEMDARDPQPPCMGRAELVLWAVAVVAAALVYFLAGAKP